MKDLFGNEIKIEREDIDMTNIEVVRLYRVETESPIKAFADIQFGEDYVVKGFKVVEGREGLFIAMPSELGRNGKWYNTFIPLNDDVKQKIGEIVLKTFEE